MLLLCVVVVVVVLVELLWCHVWGVAGSPMCPMVLQLLLLVVGCLMHYLSLAHLEFHHLHPASNPLSDHWWPGSGHL